MGLLQVRITEDWDRSHFCLGPEELEVEEARRCLRRVLDRPGLDGGLRDTLQKALEALQSA